jgi:membrane-bound lytic murein transglycosylase D
MFIRHFFYLTVFCASFYLYSSIIDPDLRPIDKKPFVLYDYSKKESVDPKQKLLYVLTDPDKIISDTFKVPSKLKDRVYFWASVYALYPSSSIILHDRDKLAAVYSVIDDKNLKSRRRLMASAKKERNLIKRILFKISKAGGVKKFKPKNKEETRIASLLSKTMTNEESKLAYNNIRSQDGQSNFIKKGVEISSRYMPIIEYMFKEQKLPWELTRLPFVESSFNVEAMSKVGAGGIWQIMDNTGKKFMDTDPVYDERRSPFKASAVAAKLLKENYQILGSWPLAITAYNHGPGGLKRAIKQVKTKDISEIVENYKNPRFGFASKNFYAEFIAALYVTVYANKLFENINKEQAMSFSYLKLDKDMYIKKIADISELNIKDIIFYNPELSNKMIRNIIPIKKNSIIKLPPRASYKLEDYFIQYSDEYKIQERKLRRDDINVPANN